ncbi:MAG: PD-(D/E)XK nuclease family protein [Lachnospira sp.]
MSLQLVLGSSGAGKSTFIYKKIIEESMDNPSKKYIVVVPEQYTMAIQKKMVELHPRKGILNIDVVSFERLAYKVFEEVGCVNYPVLEDTGKNLIVRCMLERHKKELEFFSGNVSNTGFVSEMKSVISEMLQYDITPEKLDRIKKDSTNEQSLQMKLDDICLIYKSFKEYISDHYITSEEILDLLCQKITGSGMIPDSVICLDGFTGFTPVQYRLLSIMLQMCHKIYVTLTIDTKEAINVVDGLENIFYLSKDTINRLYRICDESHISIDKPVMIEHSPLSRFHATPELAFLENNLFRNNGKVYKKTHDNRADGTKRCEGTKDIAMYKAEVPKDEIAFVATRILELTRIGGYKYRDIAIVTADMEKYGRLTANILRQNDIPYFLDEKRHVKGNPLVEVIRMALQVIDKNYSYESVFGYLRTGMTDLDTEQTDILDNYCLAVGIRGKKRWYEEWTRTTRMKKDEELAYLNELRKKVIEPLSALSEKLKAAGGNVGEMVKALYDYMLEMNLQERISKKAAIPGADPSFSYIYKKTIELLDRIVLLLGTETLTVREFAKVLDSGFDEIKIGLIPQTNDCVVIGDMERTRLDNIRILFFVGVNDGVVPKKSENRSVLSETDREILAQSDVILSPSPREKAFIQRFYLYLIMTKPSDKLYISYATRNLDGKPLLPSYILSGIRKMFPSITELGVQDRKKQDYYLTIPKAEIAWTPDNICETILGNMALELYGEQFVGSVTSFEQFASCRFAYFLKYGLKLNPREEYRFENVDLGNVLHSVLKQVSDIMKEKKMTFSLMNETTRKVLVNESVETIAKNYGNTILLESGKNSHMIKRITRLADRTLWAIGKQLERGNFVPDEFEAEFMTDISRFDKDGANRVLMQGRIDRIDICEDEDNVYVRVVDYKSQSSSFDMLKAYYGLKIQLLTYLNAAMEIEQKKHRGKHIVPAGILYYNIDDPIVEAADDESIDGEILKKLRMDGYVNSDYSIIFHMEDSDKVFTSIPVELNSSGGISSKSKCMTTEELNLLGRHVYNLGIENASKILSGDIAINPYKNGVENSCSYCRYKAVCGFGTDLGMKYRRLPKFDNETIMNMMKGEEEIEDNMDREPTESD